MVNGLDRVQAHFAGYTDRYVLIGGTASSVAVEELGGRFRVTAALRRTPVLRSLRDIRVAWRHLRHIATY
jgi:hypothetical protein